MVWRTGGGGRALAGIPPSIADTGMGLASNGGPFKLVGGKGTLIAATAAAASEAAVDAVVVVEVVEDEVDDDDDTVTASLGTGVDVLLEEPLLLESVASPFVPLVTSLAEGSSLTFSLSLASFSMRSISEVSRMLPTSSSNSG